MDDIGQRVVFYYISVKDWAIFQSNPEDQGNNFEETADVLKDKTRKKQNEHK
jgi:hypothetical protein